MQNTYCWEGDKKCSECGKLLKIGNFIVIDKFHCWDCGNKNKNKSKSETEDFEDLEMSNAIEYIRKMKPKDVRTLCIDLKIKINELKTKK